MQNASPGVPPASFPPHFGGERGGSAGVAGPGWLRGSQDRGGTRRAAAGGSDGARPNTRCRRDSAARCDTVSETLGIPPSAEATVDGFSAFQGRAAAPPPALPAPRPAPRTAPVPHRGPLPAPCLSRTAARSPRRACRCPRSPKRCRKRNAQTRKPRTASSRSGPRPLNTVRPAPPALTRQ